MTGILRAWLLILGLALSAAPASAEPLLPAIDTSSPQATYRSFQAEMARIEALYLAYRAAPSFAGEAAVTHVLQRLAAAVLDLSQFPPATRLKSGGAAIGDLADILNRLPELPAPPDPGPPGSTERQPPARWTMPGTEIQIVRIPEGPRAGSYVFSAETVSRLPEFHARIIGDPPLRGASIANWHLVQQRFTGALLSRLPLADLPAALQAPILSTPLWKVALALLVVLLIVAAVSAWARVVRRWSEGAAAWRRYALRLTVPALLALLVQLGHAFNAWEVVLHGRVAEAELILTSIALYVAAIWAAWVACWLVAEAVIASPLVPDNTYDANLLRLIARVGSLGAAAVLAIFGANDIGVPALGLLAGVSIGGVAMALAAQSTVENLFGGLTLFADRPFRVGDAIRYGTATGRVESIGPRSSRIRAPDSTLTTVPNADLAKLQVTNLSARDRWLFQNRLTLPQGSASADLVALVAELRRRLVSQPHIETAPGWPRVSLVGLGAGAVDIEIRAHVLVQDETAFLAIQQGLILEVLDALAASRLTSVPASPDAAPQAASR